MTIKTEASTLTSNDHNPMHVMNVLGFDLHFAEDVSDARMLVWTGPFGDTGWTLVMMCYRTRSLGQHWHARVDYEFRGEPDFLAVGTGETGPERAIQMAIYEAVARARRSLTFLSALDAGDWMDAEPEHGEAIAEAVAAFAAAE